MIKNVCQSSCKVRVYAFQISLKLEYSQQIFKQYSNINFTKICPLGAEQFRDDGWTDGQSDVMKLTVAF